MERVSMEERGMRGREIERLRVCVFEREGEIVCVSLRERESEGVGRERWTTRASVMECVCVDHGGRDGEKD